MPRRQVRSRREEDQGHQRRCSRAERQQVSLLPGGLGVQPRAVQRQGPQVRRIPARFARAELTTRASVQTPYAHFVVPYDHEISGSDGAPSAAEKNGPTKHACINMQIQRNKVPVRRRALDPPYGVSHPHLSFYASRMQNLVVKAGSFGLGTFTKPMHGSLPRHAFLGGKSTPLTSPPPRPPNPIVPHHLHRVRG